MHKNEHDQASNSNQYSFQKNRENLTLPKLFESQGQKK
jgi:hypothetical protein